MALGGLNLDKVVQETGLNGVFIVPIGAIDIDRGPWSIRGRRVRAIAPHPDDDDLFYVTTRHPETLAFLPDPYLELD